MSSSLAFAQANPPETALLPTSRCSSSDPTFALSQPNSPSTKQHMRSEGLSSSSNGLGRKPSSCALTPDPSSDTLLICRPLRSTAEEGPPLNKGRPNHQPAHPLSFDQPESDRAGELLLSSAVVEPLLASPFSGAQDMLTPPMEKSEDEGGVRRVGGGLGVDLGHKHAGQGTIESLHHGPGGHGPLSPFPITPPTSEVLRQSTTAPSSPCTPPTPYLRTVSSRTFTSTTTTTTTTNTLPRSFAYPSPPFIPGDMLSSTEFVSAEDKTGRLRTVSMGILDADSSPRTRRSRPASVRDWQSDDDEGFETATPRTGLRSAGETRSSPRSGGGRFVPPGGGKTSTKTTPSSSSTFRPSKFKATRSAPDSRTNLVGMLSAALNMSPSASVGKVQGGGGRRPGEASTPPSSSSPTDKTESSSLVVTGPSLPAISRAITAPIAPLAHVFAFLLISIAAAVALSTVLVGSYGLTAWDVTRLRVAEARTTIEDGRRRIGESVKMGRKLIEGAVDGAREFAEGLVDTAATEFGEGNDETDVHGQRGAGRHQPRSRTTSSTSNSSQSSPRKRRSTFVGGGTTTTTDDLMGQLHEGFWKVLKQIVPASTVRKVLESADVILGKRSRDERRRRAKGKGRATPRTSAGEHRRQTSQSDDTSFPPDSPPPPYFPGDARSTFSSPGTGRSPNLGMGTDSEDEDDTARRPPRQAKPSTSSSRSSTLPPRPPLSVLIPSILLTLLIAFGAMAYDLFKKNTNGQASHQASTTSGSATPTPSSSHAGPSRHGASSSSSPKFSKTKRSSTEHI